MNFVKKWVVDVDVPARFTNLMQILKQNAQQSGQQARPITTQKAELITAVKAIRIETLSLNERRLLSIFIDTNLMGNKGVEKINHAFLEHNLDPMGAVNTFNEMKAQYDRLITAANETIKVLAPIDTAIVETDIEQGNAVLQITFKEKASIGNVTEWYDSADDWRFIIRSFGLLTNTTTDQAKILSVESGSIIIEISALYIVVKAVGIAVDKTLNVIDRMLDLRLLRIDGRGIE